LDHVGEDEDEDHHLHLLRELMVVGVDGDHLEDVAEPVELEQ